MEKGKVLVIGIDGLDPGLLSKWKNELPNFKELKEKGTEIKLKSIYPIDSIPIWSSIYTGLTPANHGILGSIDYLDNISRPANIDSNYLSGKTFWDYASKFNKKVCIINPFLAYPVWKVNGIMASGPVFTGGKPQAFPQHITKRYKLPHLGGVVERYPSKKDLNTFCEKMEKITMEEAEFGLKIFKDYDWDLAFMCLITLDGIEHFFWRYFDDNDPTYPGDNPYKNTIKDFYKLFDEIIGRFSALDPDTIIVLSDHGHGMRSTKLINMNKILIEEGFLTPKSKNMTLSEKIQSKSLDSIRKSALLHDLFGKLTRSIPAIKKLKSSDINLERSSAYVSDLVGKKPFGGIKISEDIKNPDYESLRTLIIEKISGIEDPNTGEKVVKWICRRDDLYQGSYIFKYPDIVFELKDEYGTNWVVHDPFISTYSAHTIISGGHKRNATFLIKSKDPRKIMGRSITSVDLAPTILDFLNVEGDFNFDGESIFKTKIENNHDSM